MKTNITVVFSSHLSDDENKKFEQHIHNTIGCKHKVVCYQNFNEYSLTEIYNKAISEHNPDNGIMVFTHNDIVIKTPNWGRILLNKFNNSNYQIIGVAGTTYIPESGRWWEDRTKMVGIVEHTDNGQTWVSEYSLERKGEIIPVVTIDGLFMAIDFEEVYLRFDENYSGFHFYDVPFITNAYLDGFNVGVTTDIRILHKSIGMTNDQWEENRKQFAYDYKDDLPIKYVSDDRLKILICCQFFSNYTGSEMSVYELSKELAKTCDVTIISSIVGEPLRNKAIKNGVKVYSLYDPPNYKLNQNNQFQFIMNEIDFDIIHINHKPIGEIILQLYPNTPAVMHIRSEVIPKFEEPIIHQQIKKYISIRDSITEYIKSYGVKEDNIVVIDNPFDTERFNINYSQIDNERDVILFVGTLDHLRRNILLDLKKMVTDNNQILWIVGNDTNGYASELVSENIIYFGVQKNVEDYMKKCTYTAGIFKGRTTIEGFLCGKPGWIYEVDSDGNILNKEFTEVPDDLYKYYSDFSAKKIYQLYLNILEL